MIPPSRRASGGGSLERQHERSHDAGGRRRGSHRSRLGNPAGHCSATAVRSGAWRHLGHRVGLLSAPRRIGRALRPRCTPGGTARRHRGRPDCARRHGGRYHGVGPRRHEWRRSPIAAMLDKAGLPDEVLLAYGVLGEQAAAQDSADETRRIIDINFTSAALWLQLAARHLLGDRPRTLVVIGSVAGGPGTAIELRLWRRQGRARRFRGRSGASAARDEPQSRDGQAWLRRQPDDSPSRPIGAALGEAGSHRGRHRPRRRNGTADRLRALVLAAHHDGGAVRAAVAVLQDQALS